jgi:hypothetical protein
MCIICDGHTHDDHLRSIELHIAIYGWSIAGVEPGPDAPAGPVPLGTTWAYTIGLRAGFGMPELIVMDTKFASAQRLLNRLAERLTSGATLDEIDAEFDVDHGPVHAEHLFRSDLVNTWSAFYGRPPAPGTFVQVVPPADVFCSHHQTQTDLSIPGPIAHRPGRAARRLAERSRRRR